MSTPSEHTFPHPERTPDDIAEIAGALDRLAAADAEPRPGFEQRMVSGTLPALRGERDAAGRIGVAPGRWFPLRAVAAAAVLLAAVGVVVMSLVKTPTGSHQPTASASAAAVLASTEEAVQSALSGWSSVGATTGVFADLASVSADLESFDTTVLRDSDTALEDAT